MDSMSRFAGKPPNFPKGSNISFKSPNTIHGPFMPLTVDVIYCNQQEHYLLVKGVHYSPRFF